jgi:hypothetical protein
MVRRLGAVVVAFGLLLALAAPVFATDLNPSHVGAIGSQFQQGEDCDSLDLEPGSVLWHFVLTDPAATSGNLTATFETAGTIGPVANGDPQEATVLHFYITTPTDDKLLSASTDVSGGNLNLSHTCFEPGEEIPEAPIAALLPAVLIAAFGGYLVINRRRSNAAV